MPQLLHQLLEDMIQPIRTLLQFPHQRIFRFPLKLGKKLHFQMYKSGQVYLHL